MRKRPAIIITIGMLSVVLIIGVYGLFFAEDVYNSTKNWLQSKARHGNYAREIGTNKDLWLNGYLGIFFRFKRFGWLNWLAIPLFIYFLITIKKRERWEIALCLALFMASIFICLKGYRNYRYQLTLFPVLITTVFLFGWQILKNQNQKVIGTVLLTCGAIILLHIYTMRDNYYRKHLNPYVFKEEFPFPYKIIKYIKNNVNVDDENVVLEYNQPLLYYYTNNKGVSYKDKKINAIKKIIKKNKNKEAFRILKDELKVKYVLTTDRYDKKRFEKYDSDLVCQDHGYKLYKIRASPYTLTLDAFNKRTPVFETDFSDWKWPDEMSIDDIAKTGGPVKIGGFRGDFIFKRISAKDGNILRVMLKRPWANKVPKVQFGFCDKSILNVDGGDIVSVIARVRLSASNKKGASLFVQDRTNKWAREKVYFGGNLWKDRLIYRKIREGNSNFGMGIYWKPESTEEWLDIKSVRIYVRK